MKLSAAVVVVQNASVYDLKKAVERHVTVKQEREDGATVISWCVYPGISLFIYTVHVYTQGFPLVFLYM